MEFKQLADIHCRDRGGARLFGPGSIVYIHPDIKPSDRYPVVTEEMAALYGVKCCVVLRDDGLYKLDCIDDNSLAASAWRLHNGYDYQWADWMLLSEAEYAAATASETDESSFFTML